MDPREMQCAELEDKFIKITDARRVGVMLRDGYLTLRAHSTITSLQIDPVTARTFKLRVPAIGGDRNYIAIENNTWFRANANASTAATFTAKQTELGYELRYNNERPAIHDRYFDVTIGPWSSTGLARSQIPMLLWPDLALDQIWNPGNPYATGTAPGISNKSLD